MKKIFFYVISACLFVLFLLSFILRFVFEDLTAEFSGAAGGFFLALFMLFNMKFAFKPVKNGGASHPVKAMFQKMGKPQVYRSLCLGLFVIFLFIGLFKFGEGLFALIGK